MEDQTSQTLGRIQRKVKRLVEMNDILEEKMVAMDQENQVLKRTIQSYEWKLTEMKEQKDVQRITSTIKDEKDDNKAVKLKINELVREIDKCIALIAQ